MSEASKRDGEKDQEEQGRATASAAGDTEHQPDRDPEADSAEPSARDRQDPPEPRKRHGDGLLDGTGSRQGADAHRPEH